MNKKKRDLSDAINKITDDAVDIFVNERESRNLVSEPRISDFVGKVEFKDGGNIITSIGKSGKITKFIEIEIDTWRMMLTLTKNNYEKAYLFQNKIGNWITDAINEKIEKENKRF